MLGILLIYFIGKYFHDLALEFNKNKWLFAILGIATYYAGTFIFGFIIGFYVLITGDESVLELPDIVLGLMALPFGLLLTWGLYALLRKNWKNKPVLIESDLLDDVQN